MEYEKIALKYFSWFSNNFKSAKSEKKVVRSNKKIYVELNTGKDPGQLGHLDNNIQYNNIESMDKHADVLSSVANMSLEEFGIEESNANYDWDMTYSYDHNKSIAFSDYDGLMVDASAGDQKNAVVYLRFYRTDKLSGKRTLSTENNPVVFLQKDNWEWKIVDIDFEND